MQCCKPTILLFWCFLHTPFVQDKKISRSEDILDTLQTTSEAWASSKLQHSDRILKYSRAKQLFFFGELSISGNSIVFSKKCQKNFCRAKTGDPRFLSFCADSASNQPSTLTNHHLLESCLQFIFVSGTVLIFVQRLRFLSWHVWDSEQHLKVTQDVFRNSIYYCHKVMGGTWCQTSQEETSVECSED